jgi:hypothetical protein
VQRLALELAAALLADPEPRADLGVRFGLLAPQSVAAQEDLAVAVGQQRRLLGNFPQAFSHIALVSSAFKTSRPRAPAARRHSRR